MHQGNLEDAKNRILSHVSLETLVGEYIELHNRSGRKFARCPFHDDKNPSLTIYDDRYFCFGCRAHGDAIDFIRQIKGYGFIETLKFLAEKYHCDVPELTASKLEFQQQRKLKSFYQLLSSAQDFFISNLKSELGKEAKEYLMARGFQESNIATFEFGLTLNSSNNLTQHLKSLGFTIEDIVSCSLANRSSSSTRVFDFFQNRIMIPIKDHYGRVVAFGGRALAAKDPAKYKNSRETLLFDKSKTVFGLYRAKEYIREQRKAIIVEGYMDTLQLWQHNIDIAVACLGTALTKQQLQQISSYTKNIILVFDGDGAGQAATLRTANVAMETGIPFEFRVVVLPRQEDPDTFLKNYGKEAFMELVNNATELLEFAIKQKIKDASTNAIPDIIGREFIPWLCQVTNHLKRGFLISKISEYTGVMSSYIETQLKDLSKRTDSPTIKALPHPETQEGTEGFSFNLSELLFEIFGHLYYAEPDDQLDCEKITDFIEKKCNLHPLLLQFAKEMLVQISQKQQPAKIPPLSWQSSETMQTMEFIDKLNSKAPAFQVTGRKQKIEIILKHYHQIKVKKSIAELRNQLARLSSGNNSNLDEQTKLLTSIKALNDELRQLEKQ